MLNFRPITEPFIKLCGDMAEEIKQLKYENAELKEMIESTRHDLFYTREQNRFLSESLADLQNEKRKDLEKRVADLEEQLALTGKLTVMDETTEEKLEVGKWYDARTFEEETLKKLLPVGTLVTIITDWDIDEKRNLTNCDSFRTAVSPVTSIESEVDEYDREETYIYVDRYKVVTNNWFKILKEY